MKTLTLTRLLQLSSLLEQRFVQIHEQVCDTTVFLKVPGAPGRELSDVLSWQTQFLMALLGSVSVSFSSHIYSSSSMIILAFAFCSLMLSKNSK